MIYLLCFIASLNIVLLVEQVLSHSKQQEMEGKMVGYGRTFIFYLLQIIVIGSIVYAAIKFFKLG